MFSEFETTKIGMNENIHETSSIPVVNFSYVIVDLFSICVTYFNDKSDPCTSDTLYLHL